MRRGREAEEGEMIITAAQLKEARQLLGWSQDDVANASGLRTEAIVYFDHGKRSPDLTALFDTRRTLEAAGVEFTNGGESGVKLRASQ
jgi:transcriptional regulator with XRE-family HTH domain